MLCSVVKDLHLQSVRTYGGDRHVEKAMDVLGRFMRYMDPIHFRDCTEFLVQEFLIRRKKDKGRKGEFLSPASLNCDVRYLNAFFKWAAERHENGELDLGVPDNWKQPKMKRFKETKRKPRSLTIEDLERLFQACDQAHLPKIPGIAPPDWWRAFWAVAYCTGLRCKALLEVRMPTPELMAEHVLPCPAESDKSSTERTSILTPVAVALIEKLNIEPGELLFAWPCQRPWFYRTVHRFQDKAGIPRDAHALPHDLRRTKATMMIKSGAPLPIVQRQLGHASPEMTARCYVGQVSEEEREFVNRMPQPASARKKDPQREFAFV